MRLPWNWWKKRSQPEPSATLLGLYAGGIAHGQVDRYEHDTVAVRGDVTNDFEVRQNYRSGVVHAGDLGVLHIWAPEEEVLKGTSALGAVADALLKLTPEQRASIRCGETCHRVDK